MTTNKLPTATRVVWSFVKFSVRSSGGAGGTADDTSADSSTNDITATATIEYEI